MDPRSAGACEFCGRDLPPEPVESDAGGVDGFRVDGGRVGEGPG